MRGEQRARDRTSCTAATRLSASAAVAAAAAAAALAAALSPPSSLTPADPASAASSCLWRREIVSDLSAASRSASARRARRESRSALPSFAAALCGTTRIAEKEGPREGFFPPGPLAKHNARTHHDNRVNAESTSLLVQACYVVIEADVPLGSRFASGAHRRQRRPWTTTGLRKTGRTRPLQPVRGGLRSQGKREVRPVSDARETTACRGHLCMCSAVRRIGRLKQCAHGYS